MRLVTYNIRHGAPAGARADHRAMGASVASLRGDLVALQEVDRHVVRSWFRDQTAGAAAASGTVGHFAAARRFGPGGRYGNALLVRGRTLRTRVLQLPGRGEPRVALFAEVQVARTALTVVSTHLQNRRGDAPSEAPEQLTAVLEELTRHREPWVVMGDLNLRPDVVDPVLVAAGLVPVVSPPTFPADAPRIVIDRIAVKGLRVVDVVVPDVRTSDHRPLVVDVVGSAGGDADGSTDTFSSQ